MMNVALATISTDLHVDPVILPWIVAVIPCPTQDFWCWVTRGGYVRRRRFCIFGLLPLRSRSAHGHLCANVWALITARSLEGIGSAFFIPRASR